MEEKVTSVTPWKKRKVNINLSHCIICQSSNKRKRCVETPLLEKMKRLIDICRERESYGDGTVKGFVERIKDMDVEELKENEAFYHKECYSKYANKEKLERAKKRYHNAVESGSSAIAKRKAGRPSLSVTVEKEEERSTRSKVYAVRQKHVYYLSKAKWEMSQSSIFKNWSKVSRFSKQTRR